MTMTQTMGDLTVRELVAALDRHKKALAEGGRPDLAELASARITSDGVVRFSYQKFIAGEGRHPVPEVEKALEIDPVIQRGLEVVS